MLYWPQLNVNADRKGDNVALKQRSISRRKNSRDLILAIATKHFGKYGYLGTSLEQVAQDAGVTRGALYHHFTDKHDLFRLVCHKLQNNAAKKIDKAIKNATDPWDAYMSAIHSAIDSSSGFETRRILFIDRVAILSWEEWHAIDMDTVSGSMRPAMARAMEEGYMERRPIPPLFFIIAASISRITIIAADSDEITLDDIHQEFDELLSKYKIDR